MLIFFNKKKHVSILSYEKFKMCRMVLYFKIDKTDIESGVQEGIKKMKEGEKAVFIIPSHLAHGITGDNNKIPPITPLVVDVELLKLTN